jgi:hypothetical protein
MEKYVSIIGCEQYQVSDLGNIKHLACCNYPRKKYGRIEYKEKIRKLTEDKDGYLAVTISVNGKIKTYKVHRLVAKYFIPNPENKPQVNHKEGNKKDNRAIMLEWCNQSENNIHAFSIGLMKPQDLSGSKNPRYKTGINERGSFPKKCEQCKNKFEAKIKRYRFCSRSCVSEYRKLPEKRIVA